MITGKGTFPPCKYISRHIVNPLGLLIDICLYIQTEHNNIDTMH